MDTETVNDWLIPRGPLRSFTEEEKNLLLWLLRKPGLPESGIVEAQLKSAVVHEVDRLRYLELFTAASCPLLTTVRTALYVDAFCVQGETQGIGALLHIVNYRVAALEFDYPPDLRLAQLPELDDWQYL